MSDSMNVSIVHQNRPCKICIGTMASLLHEFDLIYIYMNVSSDCYLLFQVPSTHITSIHDDTSLDIDTLNCESEGIEQFDCPLCLSSFPKMETMKSHVFEVHSRKTNVQIDGIDSSSDINFNVQPQNQQQETNGNYEIVHNGVHTGEILPMPMPIPAPRTSKRPLDKLNSDLTLPKPKKRTFYQQDDDKHETIKKILPIPSTRKRPESDSDNQTQKLPDEDFNISANNNKIPECSQKVDEINWDEIDWINIEVVQAVDANQQDNFDGEVIDNIEPILEEQYTNPEYDMNVVQDPEVSNENLQLPSTPSFEQEKETETSSFINKKKLTWKKIQTENRKSKKQTNGKRKAESKPKVKDPMPDSTSNYEVVCGERENTKLYAMDGYLYTKNTVKVKQAFLK